MLPDSGAKMQANPRRPRCAKWTTEETIILAKLKREASLQGKVGDKVWKDISSRIPCRSALQCRRRWETLAKVYKHITDYCLYTGQDLKDLSEDQFASMKLETAHHPDWYTIVEDVCGRRRNLPGRDSDQLTPAPLSRGSIALSTTTEESVITSPDNHPEINTTNERREESDVEVRRESVKSRGDTYTDEVSAQPVVPLTNLDDAADEPNSLDERTMTGSESVVSQFPRQDQRFHGADKIILFNCFSPPIWFSASSLPEDQVQGSLSGEQTVADYNYMSNPLNQGGRYPECGTHYSPSLRSGHFDSSPPHTIAKYVVRSRNESSDDLLKSMSKLNLSGAARSASPSRHSRSDSKEDQRLSKPRVIELKVHLCCDECVRKVTKVLKDTKGVKGPVTCDRKAMKVSVTATAVPKVVLERVRTVKKDADFWPESKPSAN